MKLIDLLVRELAEWPEGVAILVQDNDEQTTQLSYNKPTGEWDSMWSVFLSELATDHETAIVTKEQWQAARMREDGISN